MAATSYINMIIPQIWNKLLPMKIAELSQFLNSRAVFIDNNSPFKSYGVYQHRPFVRTFSTHMVVPTADTDLTINNLASGDESCVCVHRAIALGEEQAPIRRQGESLVDAFARTQAEYLNQEYEYRLWLILQAIFGSGGALNASHRVNEFATTDLSIESLIAAKGKLGDKSSQLKSAFMHSDVYNRLVNDGLVQWRNASTLGYETMKTGMIPTIGDMEIVSTDLAPKITVAGGGYEYQTYLFGDGAVYFTNPFFNILKDTLVLRGGGTDLAVYVSDFCCHIPGVSWNDTLIQNPTDSNLSDATKWTKVAENNKFIPIVCVPTKG